MNYTNQRRMDIDLDTLRSFNPDVLQGNLFAQPHVLPGVDLDTLREFNPDCVGSCGCGSGSTQSSTPDEWPPIIDIPVSCPGESCSKAQKRRCDRKCGGPSGCLMISWNGGSCKPECVCLDEVEAAEVVGIYG